MVVAVTNTFCEVVQRSTGVGRPKSSNGSIGMSLEGEKKLKQQFEVLFVRTNLSPSGQELQTETWLQ